MNGVFHRKSSSSDSHGTYAAPHELSNEVRIILPEFYFGAGPWPEWIHLPDFQVLPGPAGDSAYTVKQRSPGVKQVPFKARGGISAKAVGEAIWHLMCQDFAKFPHVAMSAASGDDRLLTITGPHMQVMELLMHGWSVEQSGPGIFLTETVVIDYRPKTYTGDDVFVTVIADFHTSR